MTAKESLMVSYYKDKIKELQHSKKYYESIGKGGMCIKIQGKIEAFNAVISDLINEKDFLNGNIRESDGRSERN